MLSDELIIKVTSTVKQLATHSWEYGTAAHALLELHNPNLTVFRHTPFPNNKTPVEGAKDTEGLMYAKQHILDSGSKTLCANDTGVADPASLGVAAIMLGQIEPEYLEAAQRQIRYLLDEAPRYGSIAISHRNDVEEAWADFIYMVPPLLALYAVAVDDVMYMKAAIEQCNVYHEILCSKSLPGGYGLWHHIVGPKHGDAGFWCAGNGWVAAGLVRVLATMNTWGSSLTWEKEIYEAKRKIKGVLDGVMAADPDPSGETLLPNYLAAEDEEPWFGDVAGTALLASVAYRMMVLYPGIFDGDSLYKSWAEKKSKAVFESIDVESGIARPAVNSLKHDQREPLMTGNPEAQSFVVILWAAMRDYHTYNTSGE